MKNNGLQQFRSWPSGATNIVYINRPGQMDSVEQARLLEVLAPIAFLGFGREPTDTSGHILGSEHLFVIEEEASPIGFASVRTHRYGIHLDGIVFLPGSQQRGLGGRVLDLVLEVFPDAEYLTLTTQSPVMYCVLRSRSIVVYPNPSERVPAYMAAMAIEILENCGAKLNPYLVLEGWYEHELYPSIPVSTDSKVNQFFWEILRICDGQSLNGFFCIGQIRNSA